jgi:hypothetical protein
MLKAGKAKCAITPMNGMTVLATFHATAKKR